MTLWAPFICSIKYHCWQQSSWRIIWTTSCQRQLNDDNELLLSVIRPYSRILPAADSCIWATILAIVRVTSAFHFLPPTIKSLQVSHFSNRRSILLTSCCFCASPSHFSSSLSSSLRASLACLPKLKASQSPLQWVSRRDLWCLYQYSRCYAAAPVVCDILFYRSRVVLF